MKKYIPVGIVVLGVVVVVVVFLVSKFLSGGAEDLLADESAARELTAQERPFTSLTPSVDGHELKLVVENIDIEGVVGVDYELLYTVEDGRTQGGWGTVAINPGESVERDLLLGSESAGKKRFDEGVERGMLTLRFRDEKGRLIAKLATDWHLQNNTGSLTSIDGAFQHEVKNFKGVFFVVMDTFGLKGGATEIGPHYNVFASDGRGRAL